MTSPDYSTTRRLTSEKPACFDTPVDGMQTLLKTPDSEQKIAEGGLRLQGLYKTSSEDKPLITVVTVVYNGAEFLEETIKSVIEQTYDNVEYIIVDGGSTDGTLEIIKKYDHAIDYWVSEPDKGIYDAMNKGIDLGNGDWINFMNAGDSFFSFYVLYNIFKFPYSGVEIIFGKSETVYKNLSAIRYSCFDIADSFFYKKRMPNHQAVFVKKCKYKENKFRLDMPIGADTDYLLNVFSVSSFSMVDIVVSKFYLGGISSFYGSVNNLAKIINDDIKNGRHQIITIFLHAGKFLLQKALGRNAYLFLYLLYLRLKYK